MTLPYRLIAAVVVLFATFGGGYYTAIKTAKPEIKIVPVDKPVFRYLKELKPDDDGRLFEWYKSELKLTGVQDGYDFHVRAYDDAKEVSQTFKINVGASGNWKFYVGVGAAGAVVGGYAVYKGFKLLR